MKLQILLNTIKNIVPNDMTVTSQSVQKGSVTLTGISIGKGDIRPVVYMEYYEDVFREKGYLGVAREMVELSQNFSNVYDIDVENMTDWNYAKEHLILCVSPAGTNRDLTIPYLDLELYFRVDTSQATYTVTENMRETWNVTKEELLEISEKNEYKIADMRDTLMNYLVDSGATDDEIAEVMAGQSFGVTITNSAEHYGASAIYCKELLKFIADQYESDIYIIPSSVHEILIHPIGIASKEDMDAMVKSVNSESVNPEDRLANHVYIFKRDGSWEY